MYDKTRKNIRVRSIDRHISAKSPDWNISLKNHEYHIGMKPANPDTTTPVSMVLKTCEKICKKFASQVSRHDNAD